MAPSNEPITMQVVSRDEIEHVVWGEGRPDSDSHDSRRDHGSTKEVLPCESCLPRMGRAQPIGPATC